MSLDRLGGYTNTTRDGTDAYHLIEGAKKIGLNAKGVKCDIEYLRKLNTPLIAHIIIENRYQHFIVVYKINKKSVKVMDPNLGFKTYKIDEFINIWTGVVLVFYPNKQVPIIKNRKNLISFVINLLKPYKKYIFIALVISLIITFASIISSYYIESLINAINTNRNPFGISILFVEILILKILSEYYRSKIVIFMNKNVDKTLTEGTLKHILSLPYKYYKNKSVGDILTRIGDLNYIKQLVQEGILTIFIDSVLIVFSSVFLYKINEKLFIISIITSIIYILCVTIFNKVLYPKIEKNFEYQSNLNSYLVECINGYETTKGINICSNIYNKFKNKFYELLSSTININRISNIEETIKNIIDYFGNFIILFIGSTYVMNNTITIGELITFNALYTYFVNPIKNIVNYQILIKKGIISLKRVNELYDIEEEKLYEHGNKNIEFTGNINICNLNYTYDEVNNVLNNVNISIKQYDKIILLGKSGSGKSTLMKLILKYYKCKRNMIKIDNIDINDYNLKNIRDNIVYVSQQEMLYNDTIFNNIDLGRNNDIKDVEEICDIANISEIVNKTPLGLDLMIEENGFNLSGGERQRIVLGRTLISNFKMLIMDESTNQIDVKQERIILKKILEKYKDKTIIFISHRDNNKDLFNKVINI